MFRLMRPVYVLTSTFALLALSSNAEAGPYAFGIGKVICFGTCPPGQTCAVFSAPFPVIGFQEWCACVPGTPAPPPPGPGPAPVTLVGSLDAGLLTLSGTWQGSPFAGDPIIGASISFSGALDLIGAVGAPDDGLAVFLPSAPVAFSVGDYLSGTVSGVVYREDPSPMGGRFSVTVTNLVKGPDQSDFVDAIFSLEGLLGLGLGVDAPTPLFSSIQAGQFGPTTMVGIAEAVVPEPGSVGLLGLGSFVLIVSRAAWGRARASTC